MIELLRRSPEEAWAPLAMSGPSRELCEVQVRVGRRGSLSSIGRRRMIDTGENSKGVLG